MQNVWSILKNFSYALERTCMLLLCWVFCIQLLSLVGLLCFLNPQFSWLSSVCFSSHYWEYGVEITNYYGRNIYIYSLQLYSFLVLYILVRYINVWIVISSYCIDLFVSQNCLWFNVYFYVSIATPILFWLLLAWNIFFHSFIFSLFVSLYLKWVSYREYIVESCYILKFIFSVSIF